MCKIINYGSQCTHSLSQHLVHLGVKQSPVDLIWTRARVLCDINLIEHHVAGPRMLY